MSSNRLAAGLLIAGCLAGCSAPAKGPFGEGFPEFGDRLFLCWEPTRGAALAEAKRTGKPVMFAEMPGPAENAWFRETAWFIYGPLQDPRVRQALADRFVLGWNPYSNFYCHSTFRPEIVLKRPDVRPGKSPPYGILMVFITPSGEIRHMLTEALEADAFLEELDRVSELLRADVDFVPCVRDRFHAQLAAVRADAAGHVGPPLPNATCPCDACVAARLADCWGPNIDPGNLYIPPTDSGPYGGK